ncbi:hypothetical protein M409DRAFT_20753 [Zasmidium cellare ATCC 36951]|uniref:DUF1445 domain-containing protein n=1 Tax=Zasmidium cellare ATCC 36951 TaxID=1080233 RepID=A0A6A6CNP1_ZASCE|nr:uncharacterized protein M409DRAFT_20753 [Zasmidium cellare ATCC 36951]KAF2168735.1 hypothetical protein M409DRAFT_20753 [Zasmidium cellare ATCC 36951]
MAPARTIEIPQTGLESRLAARNLTWDRPTCGMAPGYLQANLIVLPSKAAKDFEILCARNPVPCPLLAKSASPGDFNSFVSCASAVSNEKIAAGIDIRTDAPRYNIYRDGVLVEESIASVEKHWQSDHVALLIGCSYSFENALAAAGLTPPHVLHERNVTMYTTNIPLCAAGGFVGGKYVVSMRMYRASEVERVRDITRPYVTTHGEPIAWGWDGMRDIGIHDLGAFDWGDAPVLADGKPVIQSEEESKDGGYVPVFWGCGVTPQEAVMKAKTPGIVIGHAPGHMVVLDVKEEDVLRK